jgi:hypothetical protein
MNLLRSGTDIATIALWLGHASTKSTDLVPRQGDARLC